MENKEIKCSSIEHPELKAIVYCLDCKVYMCNKCEIFHSKLCKFHCIKRLESNQEENFTGFCKEKGHNIKLEYFCKNHNDLCCAACLCKLKNKGNGKHTDCEVVNLEEIKDEKLANLKDNIKLLEKLLNNIDESINKLKNTLETINNTKEQLKLKVQKIFTRIRNEINNREEFLLLEIDKQFEEKFLKENILKENEKLPKKIQLELEKVKQIENCNILSLIIYKCINIENNIKNINLIQENNNKFNKFLKTEISFNPKEEKFDNFLNTIEKFLLNIMKIYLYHQ